MRSARLADIKRITPALINDEYSPTEISNLNWAVSAQVCKGDEEIEIGTAVERTAREYDEDDIRSYERRIVKINGQKITSQSELGKYISAIWLTPQMDRLFAAFDSWFKANKALQTFNRRDGLFAKLCLASDADITQ